MILHLLVFICSIGGAILLSQMINRSVAKPMVEMTATLNNLSDNKFPHLKPMQSRRDEIGKLHEATHKLYKLLEERQTLVDGKLLMEEKEQRVTRINDLNSEFSKTPIQSYRFSAVLPSSCAVPPTTCRNRRLKPRLRWLRLRQRRRRSRPVSAPSLPPVPDWWNRSTESATASRIRGKSPRPPSMKHRKVATRLTN